MSLSKYSSVVSSRGMLVGFMPAQLKTWLILWNLSRVAEMKDWTCVVEPTSTSWVSVGVVQADATAERLEMLMSQSESEAPRDAILRTVARLDHTGGIS